MTNGFDLIKAKKKWIQGAIKRPGSLTAKAKAAGESVAQFCSHKHTGRTARQCALYHTLRKMSKKRKKKTLVQVDLLREVLMHMLRK